MTVRRIFFICSDGRELFVVSCKSSLSSACISLVASMMYVMDVSLIKLVLICTEVFKAFVELVTNGR